MTTNLDMMSTECGVLQAVLTGFLGILVFSKLPDLRKRPGTNIPGHTCLNCDSRLCKRPLVHLSVFFHRPLISVPAALRSISRSISLGKIYFMALRSVGGEFEDPELLPVPLRPPSHEHQAQIGTATPGAIWRFG